MLMKPPILDLDAFEGVPFPVASRDELQKKGMVSLKAMGRSLVVLWNGGDPRVYGDSCPHLGLPLSMGTVEDDVVRCRYHGWAFSTEAGEVADQPTLRKPRKCRLEAYGALAVGGLVFSWLGDPEAREQARAQLPPSVLDNFSLHRVHFDCPFYLALFNAVDYAHFAEHRYYRPVYDLYRRFRRDAHIPGRPFHWSLVREEATSLHLRLEEARRDLAMYVTCVDFSDEGGVNQFQTYVTPIGPTETVYWECYRARSDSALVRAAATLAFRTVIVRLLDTEDRDWTRLAAANFLAGDNIHLSETDLPLGSHIRNFVLPRVANSAS